jgi:nucleoside-diphosphate-sugar epimerase
MQSALKKILVTGAAGQIGSELTPALRRRYGPENVVAGIHRKEPAGTLREGPFEIVDVTQRETLERAVDRHAIDAIFHLAAILSAAGEHDPTRTWQVNVGGLMNVLEVARDRGVARIVVPSSIAVFGEGSPKDHTPENTVLQPTTMYGVSKVTGELLGEYYVRRFGLDVRGLRFPGIISSETPPQGGTTDYAVEIFYAAVESRPYTCFLGPDTKLPMLYMPDCLKALLDLAEADASHFTRHSNFNVMGFSVTPAMLAAEIRRHVPDFDIRYQPDFRQAIADSWPNSLDDSRARREWGWMPQYGLAETTRDMIEKLTRRRQPG